MATNTYLEEKKSPGIMQWLIVIIIPLIFAITIAIAIMAFMGIDVLGKAKSIVNDIPFLSEVVTTEDEQVVEEKINELQAAIGEKDIEITNLIAEVDAKDQQIERLEGEIVKLNQQLEERQLEDESQAERIQAMSSSFGEMEAEVAAPIISNLEEQLAVTILRDLPNRERGLILGEMDPEVAASLTNILLKP